MQMEWRVWSLVRGYAGRIDIWDVVNEPTIGPGFLDLFTSESSNATIAEIADYVEPAFV